MAVPPPEYIQRLIRAHLDDQLQQYFYLAGFGFSGGTEPPPPRRDETIRREAEAGVVIDGECEVIEVKQIEDNR